MQNRSWLWVLAVIVTGTAVYFITRFTITPPRSDEQVAVPCVNKTVFRYKYPNDVFPMIIRDYSSDFKIASGVLDRIAGDSSGNNSVNVEVRNNARQLRDSLNQDNIFVETILRNYFLSSNSDPCNETLRDRYTTAMEEMLRGRTSMNQFITGVTTPANEVPNTAAGKDSIIAVVDTAQGKVEAIKTAKSNDLILLKNFQKIDFAVNELMMKRVPKKEAIQ